MNDLGELYYKTKFESAVELLKAQDGEIERRYDRIAALEAECDALRAELDDCRRAWGLQRAELAALKAPAQDERDAFKRALHSQKVFKLSSATIDAAEWAWFSRPAQTEQQPVAVVPDGWRVTVHTVHRIHPDDRWEVYGPNGGGVVNAGDVRDWAVRGLLDALAAQSQPAAQPAPIAQTPADGLTYMGEPLIRPYEAPREKIHELFRLLGLKGQADVGDILDAAISAIKAAHRAGGE